jgi:hypothetical protein
MKVGNDGGLSDNDLIPEICGGSPTDQFRDKRVDCWT